jgi:ribose 5-phosphate isomerase A
MKNSAENKDLKKMVGIAAAGLVRDGMICGIGTGSTVAFLIEELGRRVKEEHLSFIGVPTSFQSKLLCRAKGIATRESQDFTELDLAIDGADELDQALDAIKGGGAAHTREKIVASMAKQFVIIVDESKTVQQLGSKFPVPMEIIPVSLNFVIQKVIQLGGTPWLRMGVKKDGPVITDNGMFVIDATFGAECNLREIDQQLHHIPGIIETGLFIDLVSMALIGSGKEMKVNTLKRK